MVNQKRGKMEVTKCCTETLSGMRSSHPTFPFSEEHNCMSTVQFLTYWRGLVSFNSFSLSEIIWPIIFFSLGFFYFYISIFFLRLCWGEGGGGQNTFRTLLLDARAILILKNNILMVTENHSPFIN